MLGIVAAAALVTVSDGRDTGLFRYHPSQGMVANVAYECEYEESPFYNIDFFRDDGSNVCEGKADGHYSEQMTLYTTGSWVSINGAPVTFDETQPDPFGDFVAYVLPQNFGSIRTTILGMLYCHIFPAGNINCVNSHSVEIMVMGRDVFLGRATVSQVPVPAAAWLFLAGLFGLKKWGRRAVG